MITAHMRRDDSGMMEKDILSVHTRCDDTDTVAVNFPGGVAAVVSYICMVTNIFAVLAGRISGGRERVFAFSPLSS